MLRQIFYSCFLAWRDWKFEHLLSLCAVLALASMLAPLLVLQGLKNGIIEGMRARLLEDPSILIITPKSDAGRFSPETIAEFGKLPGARFIIGRTRDTSTDLTLENPADNLRVSIGLEPASSGEPILEQHHLAAPSNDEEPQIILSTPAASALKVKAGDELEARLGRRTPSGKLESIRLKFHVTGILPIEAADRRMGFVPLQLLEEMENYRDYIEVPQRNLAGRQPGEKRHYASFRLYAENLDAVEPLAEEFGKRHIETITRAREIAAIRILEKSINQVILIISIAVGAGFAAFTVSSVQSAVSRKQRMLGMLRLLGFRHFPLMLYPVTQTMLTAICGFTLSLLIYLAVSWGIAEAFSDQAVILCHLRPSDLLVTGAAVALLSLLACLRAAWQAASVEPSIVIREV